MLVLSLFPGVDLFGRGFEQEGFCVVRGPDLILGQDIRTFQPPPGRFDGVVGGSPCQDFSKLRRSPASGYGLAMLHEFTRCVSAAAPDWFLLENVPTVPDIQIAGYSIQRFDLRASECGLPQSRLRHFQFGSRRGYVLVLDRPERRPASVPACVASEGTQQNRRGWAEFCEQMGLPPEFELPAFTLSQRYRAVGNGVPIPMAAFLARTIRDSMVPTSAVRLCTCGCGRRLRGKQLAALPACRKRLERRRRCDGLGTGESRPVTSVNGQAVTTGTPSQM